MLRISGCNVLRVVSAAALINISFSATGIMACASEQAASNFPETRINTTAVNAAASSTLGIEILDSGRVGYYRWPDIHDDVIVFNSEGDLWRVSANGGVARRLTTHLDAERFPAISPDGTQIAFTAAYEGPTEVYTMPISGGLPTRITYEADRGQVVGWTPDGRILYTTSRYSTLPNRKLVTIDPVTGDRKIMPLHQAAEGTFDDTGQTLYFCRVALQWSDTKRYQGGTAQNLWRYHLNNTAENEAIPLTADYPGTSSRPMFWNGRLYFTSDRDETMNIWSMEPDGSNLIQHTHYRGWDVLGASIGQGEIVYQNGADLHVYNIAADTNRKVPITLSSDFDQMREKWITDPFSYLTSSHVSPSGESVVLTARGEIFVAPHKHGRIVRITRNPDVRYRNARFMPDGKRILALSDESGEVELWTLNADGTDERTQLTTDGHVLRWDAFPSPDAKWISHYDKNQKLWLYSFEHGTQTMIDESGYEDIGDLTWSPDSRWLVYSWVGANQYRMLKLYNIETKITTNLTTDRYDSYSPAWGADGKWLYFLSDRYFRSNIRGPWGARQPEPYFDRVTKIYQIALQQELRSPFEPDTELTIITNEETEAKTDEDEESESNVDNSDETAADKEESEFEDTEPIEINLDGIVERLYEVPADAGNLSDLIATSDRLYWLDWLREDDIQILKTLELTNEDIEVHDAAEDIGSIEISEDGSTILLEKNDQLYLINSDTGDHIDLDNNSVKLSHWRFPLLPREEWRQMFTEAWRLHRDYFYDPDMHGVDWPRMLDKYLPLVDRVSNRDELSNLLAQMIGELSALHSYVYGGDHRDDDLYISIGALGAKLHKDPTAGGYRIDHIYSADPDEPNVRSPLARHDLVVAEGDVITAINGVGTLSTLDIGSLLRNESGQQVLLDLVSKVDGNAYQEVVVPISIGAEYHLRYSEWEYTRRQIVEEASDNSIGYVHLRAMGGRDLDRWARDFYPVHQREGLIIDVRSNDGGSIDSLILEKLIRKIWFYWQGRVGEPTWNMQYAFPGHMVVLCDEYTASDGEAFAEGFRALGLGKVIGTRTWGGEIWLTGSNVLVDQGIATAAEFGVYGPNGDWLIEGWGVEPDIIVDNLPHATYNGEDSQLQAAILHLQKLMTEQPVIIPDAPEYPDKSSEENTQ